MTGKTLYSILHRIMDLTENNIDATVESIDFNAAQGMNPDLIVTVKELAEQFTGKKIAIVRSYINKKKIKEDILDVLLETAK